MTEAFYLYVTHVWTPDAAEGVRFRLWKVRFLSREADCRRAVSVHTAPFPQTRREEGGMEMERGLGSSFHRLWCATLVLAKAPPLLLLTSTLNLILSLSLPLALVDSRCAVAPVWLTYTVNRHLSARQSAGHWSRGPRPSAGSLDDGDPERVCGRRWRGGGIKNQEPRNIFRRSLRENCVPQSSRNHLQNEHGLL